MKFKILHAVVAASLGLGLATPALAHVGYGAALYSAAGVYDPLTNTVGAGTYGAASNFNATVASNAGYITGLDANTLGNTHDIRFRYFTLNSTSQVSFTIKGLTNANGSSTLNPGFSLYNGVLPASSHEGVGDIANVAADADVAAYLATANDFAPWSPFASVNGLRGGLAAGTAGNTPGLWGVFDTNGSITTGNNAQWNASSNTAVDPANPNYLGSLGTPKIGTITWTGIAGADGAAGATFVNSSGGSQAVLNTDGTVDNTISWSGLLGPGIYTLAIGGANLINYAHLYSDVRLSLGGTGTDVNANLAYADDRLARNLSITGFTVTAVPEPENVSMMLAGLGLMGVIARRRRKSV